MNRPAITLAIATAVCALVAPLSAFAEPTVALLPVAGDVYRFQGLMANCVMLKTGNTALVVDASESEALARGMLAAMEKSGIQDVAYLINTHWHFDHTNGNPVFAAAGATLLAQTNVRTKLEITPTQPGNPLMPANALPEITFDTDLTIFLSNETVYLYHPETNGAHTMGDSVVYFRNADILATGDILFYNKYPYIDASDNGWPQGMAAALRDVARMIGDTTIVIPGHGPVTDKAGLLRMADMVQTVGQRVQAGIDQGKTLKQIQAEKPTAEWEDTFGKDWMNGDTFVELVWNSLQSHR